MLKGPQKKIYLKEEEKIQKPEKLDLGQQSEEPEMKDNIRGEYENKIRAFASIEKKFYLFAKKGENGNYEMEYTNFFDSLLPYPYSKLRTHDEIKATLEKNPIYRKFLHKIDINKDGKISFDEYIILCVLLAMPISFFYSFSKDNKTITREQFIDAVIKFINENDVVKITQKSLFDGRIVKTDYNTFFVNLTTFTSKAFKNVKVDIEKEINELQSGLTTAILIYEFYRFPESVNDKISISNFGKVLISYINIYKKQNYLNELPNVVARFKNEEVTIEQYLSFFFYLTYLQGVLKQKEYCDKNKIIKLEHLYEIEEQFRKKIKNPHFKLSINKKQIDFMFDILDTDDSQYLDYSEIHGILKRRNGLAKSNTDYIESGGTIYKFFSNGIQFLRSNLWFLK